MTSPGGLPDPSGPTSSDQPDIALRLDGSSIERTSPTDDLASQIGMQVAMAAPPQSARVAATFALTSTAEIIQGMCADERGTIREFAIPPAAVELAREHRRLVATGPEGPWWRLVVTADPGQPPTVVADHGSVHPISPDFLFEPEVYQEEFRRCPAISAPLWLLAHTYGEGRQGRPDIVASAPINQTVPTRRIDLPDLEALWARWSAYAAITMATGAVYGAGIQPSIAIYEGPTVSGSTLVMLPEGRAVLSGGVSDDARLIRAYRTGTELPDLYAGAPGWVTDATLNIRAERDQLTFCFWYDDGGWHAAADSDDPVAVAVALPPLTTAGAVEAIAELVGRSSESSAAAAALVHAAEASNARRADLEALLPGATAQAISTALSQLQLAGAAH